jgi:hypothetical protein
MKNTGQFVRPNGSHTTGEPSLELVEASSPDVLIQAQATMGTR